MSKPINVPYSMFATHDSQDVISLAHVAMARWDRKRVPTLMVFFASSPHIELEEEDGLKFMVALSEYHRILHPQKPK